MGSLYYRPHVWNIRVEKFYLFFDFLFPLANVANFALFKYKKGDTEFGIGWFPLGGYVKIAGMVDESMDKEQMKTPPQAWEFRSKPAWQRLIVMLGGIIVNVIVIPIPSNFIEKFDKKEAVANFLIPRRVPVVDEVSKGTIADRIHLQRGDLVVAVQNQPVVYHDELKAITNSITGDSLQFSVKRGQEILSYKEYFKGEPGIGFYVPNEIVPADGEKNVKYSFGQALLIGPGRAFDVIVVQVKAFRKIFTGQLSFQKSLSGPIGMAKAYGGTWNWENFWRMTGLLSMVLAFMNLLPIPALDGGYVMFLLYEMVSGREPSEKFFENAIKVGMAILLLLMVFVFYNDIAKLVTGG
jgi:regulator of sigma E protease